MVYTVVIDQCCVYLILDQRTYHLKFLPSILHNDTFFLGLIKKDNREMLLHTQEVMKFHIHIANIYIANKNDMMFVLMGFMAGIAELVSKVILQMK